MFNLSLKIFLYTVLVICTVWGSLLFAGPKLIEYFLKNKFGNSVQVQNLRVTPKLEVIASNLEISGDDQRSNNFMNGFARGVSLSWQIRDDFVPEITISTGPLVVENMGEVESSKLILAIDYRNMRKIAFKGKLTGLKIASSAGIEQIDLIGFYRHQDFELEKLKVSSEEIYSLTEQEFSISPLTAFAESVKFQTNYTLKYVEDFKLDFREIHFQKYNFRGREVLAGFNFENEVGKLKVDLKNISQEMKNLYAEDIKISVYMSDFDLNSWNRILLSSGAVKFPASPFYTDASKLKNMNAEVKKISSDSVSVSTSGTLGEFELTSRDGFLANLSGTKFIIDADLLSKSGLNKSITSKINFQSQSEPVANFDGRAKLVISENDYIFCLIEGTCIDEIWSDYEVNIEGRKLIGSSHCVLPNCFDNGSRHSIQSENTAKFFESAKRSQIFNPFLLAVFYSSFSSAMKVGDGHLLEF